jgi:hypothetical protein
MQTESFLQLNSQKLSYETEASAESEFNHVMMSAILYKPHTERRETEED